MAPTAKTQKAKWTKEATQTLIQDTRGHVSVEQTVKNLNGVFTRKQIQRKRITLRKILGWAPDYKQDGQKLSKFDPPPSRRASEIWRSPCICGFGRICTSEKDKQSPHDLSKFGDLRSSTYRRDAQRQFNVVGRDETVTLHVDHIVEFWEVKRGICYASQKPYVYHLHVLTSRHYQRGTRLWFRSEHLRISMTGAATSSRIRNTNTMRLPSSFDKKWSLSLLVTSFHRKAKRYVRTSTTGHSEATNIDVEF